MTPLEHVAEAERLAGKAEAAADPADSVRWSHLALVHIELAKAKDMMTGPPTVAAMDRALTKARSVGRVYPLDAP
jgi:hypothetical protein